MYDLLIFLMPSGVLKRVGLCQFVDILGAFWRFEKGRFICDFLIFRVLSVVLKRVELCAIC